ncbi:hypothetical protein [Microbacterium lushaniae]|uniref:Secreted protein n=1 Tax=Microbacterium lushaniae TaxID=2614639 RepID=A0A5J6L4H2_9MICO|nr:hypothetical protein [Microbacterium lushaniae]QEW03519.1 hypothetical protein F6J85_10680 [Microbacterium lushaniae]
MRLRALAAIAIAAVAVVGGAVHSPPAHGATADCPTVYYRATNTSESSQRGTLDADDPGSDQYLGELRWCVATRFSQLTNDSGAVWVVGAVAAPTGSTALMRAMRMQVSLAYRDAGQYAPAFVLPGETVSLDRSRFTLSIDPALTRQWLAFSAIGAPLIEFVDLFTSQATPKWNAAWKCAQGAVEFVETAALEQITIEEVIEAAYAAPDTAKSCGELASEARRITGKPPARRAVLTTADDLIRASSELDEVPRPAAARSLLDAYCRVAPSRLGC